jgi:hypothetical protein
MLVIRKSSFPPLPPGTRPLPSHLARKAETHLDWLSALPQPGTPFCDPNAPFQWAEFETYAVPSAPTAAAGEEAQNSAVTAVTAPTAPTVPGTSNTRDLVLWHYLGATSTDSRAQYTHDPRVAVHNPRSNFLDTVGASRRAVSGSSAGLKSTSRSPYGHQHISKATFAVCFTLHFLLFVCIYPANATL